MSFFNRIASWLNGTDEAAPEDKMSLHTPADRSEETADTEKATVPVTTPSHGYIAANGNDGLFSATVAEQRFSWHRLLMEFLKEAAGENDLRPFKHTVICILKKKGADYKWNDKTFKTELLQELNDSGLAYIGKSSFNIEVVTDSVFNQRASRHSTDNLFILKRGDVLLCGSRSESEESRFVTAIDKRAFIVNAFIKAFRNSTGTDSRLMENLLIQVVRNDDDDMSRYDWVGKRFEDDLRKELSNAFLDHIGSKSIEIVLCPKEETAGSLVLIDNIAYYRWTRPQDENESAQYKHYVRTVASVSIIEGTGSLVKENYTLDSDRKKLFHIGRGASSQKSGKFRINDIVVKENDADPFIAESNAHVSSAHADIIYKNNRFYLKAAPGGCRATGGSPTKLVRDEKAVELRDTTLLYPLEDGDIIELGKKLLLTFTIGAETPI